MSTVLQKAVADFLDDWGADRDIVAGGLPPEISPQEADRTSAQRREVGVLRVSVQVMCTI